MPSHIKYSYIYIGVPIALVVWIFDLSAESLAGIALLIAIFAFHNTLVQSWARNHEEVNKDNSN